EPAARRYGLALVIGLAWQFATGLGNVVLGWPLLAAVAHTGGAAALIAVLTALLTDSHPARLGRTAAVQLVPAS
ncbi:COX15/CtaA family protein, partial [Escherichia coli]|nr:COX15/CtaA family protein [Escherichia coli]